MRKLKTKTEEEVLEVIENVVARLAPKIKVGYLDLDDRKQLGRQLAIEGLEKYNELYPLENFLYVHVHNRLHNEKRKYSIKYEPPCVTCPFYDPNFKKSDNQCMEFVNKRDCDKYASWEASNFSKKSIVSPVDISLVDHNSEDNMYAEVDLNEQITQKEMLQKIDLELDVLLRADWLRFKAGVSIPKNRKLKLLEEVKRILGVSDGS